MLALFRVLLRGGRLLTLSAVVAGVTTGVATMSMIAVLTRSIGVSATPTTLWTFVGAAMLVLVGGAVASNTLVRVTQAAVDCLRLRVVDDVLGMTLRRFESYGPSRVMSLLTDDLNAVGQAVQALPLLLVNTVVVLAAGVYIGTLSVITLGLIAVAATLGAVTYGWVGRWASSYLRRARDIQDDMHLSFEGVAHGIKDIKLDDELRTVLVEGELRQGSSDLRQAIVKGSTISLVTGYWGQLLFLACIGLVVFAGPALGIPARDQFGIALAVLYMNTPLVTVLNILPVLARANIALSRIEEVGAAESHDLTTTTVPDIIDSIGLKEVTFSYKQEDESFRVGPVSHTFRRGTVTFLVGGNGSGKSTLGKIAAGLYLPDDGSVLVDGVPLDREALPGFRRHVSACFADSYVFPHVTGTSSGHLERLGDQVDDLGLTGVVELGDARLTYDGLSSGQRKRVALAKILAEPRDIVLLDEWAAEQDPTFRSRFYEEILPDLKAQNRIVIVISHDDRYFDLADAVVKLERGAHVATIPA